MPSHWGHKELNIVSQSSPTGTQCLQAIGCAEAALLYERVTAIEGREARFAARRSHLRLARRRHDERRRVLGVAELRLPRPPAGRLPRRGQRLRDLGSGRSADGRRRHLASWSSSFPGLLVQSIDGTDFLASYRAMREAVAYARARKGPALVHAKVIAAVLALAVGRREAVQDAGRARRRKPTRDPIVRLARTAAWPKAWRPTSELAAIARRRRPRSQRGRRARARGAEADVDTVSALRLLARRRSDVGRVRDAEPAPEGKPDTMVAAINRTLKDEMARDPRIVVFGEDVADCSREDALTACRARAASSRSRTACSARSAATASSTRRSPKPTSSAAPSAWRRAASSRWSRSSSSTTSGRR